MLLIATYINCNAETKAESDIIVTSSNAETIINALPEDKPIIFAPDKNLRKILDKRTGQRYDSLGRKLYRSRSVFYGKNCKTIGRNPDAKLIAHPEAETAVLRFGTFYWFYFCFVRLCSKKMIVREFIVATEEGILHQMRKRAPAKTINSSIGL